MAGMQHALRAQCGLHVELFRGQIGFLRESQETWGFSRVFSKVCIKTAPSASFPSISASVKGASASFPSIWGQD